MNHHFDRTIEHVKQLLVLGPAQRRSKVPAPSNRPDGRRSRSSRATSAGVIGAVVAPIAFAALLIPGRDALSESLSLLTVLPIAMVAVAGGTRLATIAAVSDAHAFGMFHTEAYYRFAIDQSARSSIEAILQTRSSNWRAGERCTAAPTLQRSGAFSATNAVMSHQLDRLLDTPGH